MRIAHCFFSWQCPVLLSCPCVPSWNEERIHRVLAGRGAKRTIYDLIRRIRWSWHASGGRGLGDSTLYSHKKNTGVTVNSGTNRRKMDIWWFLRTLNMALCMSSGTYVEFRAQLQTLVLTFHPDGDEVPLLCMPG